MIPSCTSFAAPPKFGGRADGSPVLLDRHEDGVAHLAPDRLREVALAGRILDQEHLAGADDAALAVAGRDLHPGVEVDDVLAAGRRVPVEIILGLGLAEDDPGGGKALGELAAAPLLNPLDLDVPEVRLAVGVGIQIVD